ncbi:MAG: DUF3592 domain-containing protein [Nocardiopsaceae bacterium]|nr:DUF3592 domain-containing protein [Nocardiopsaceae bacterium]
MFITSAVTLVLGALLLVIDLYYGALLVLTTSLAAWSAVRGTRATGQVVGVTDRRPGQPAKVRIAYETPGGRFEATARSPRTRIGEPVTVWYRPDRPAKAIAQNRPWRRAAIGLPITLVLAASSVGMLAGSAWYFAGTHPQLQLPVSTGSFALAGALACYYLACNRYALLLRWRRMARADGTVTRQDAQRRKPRFLISFEAADGTEEFWARAASVRAGVGDTVTVHYDPGKPATSATVQTAATVRSVAIKSTACALAFTVAFLLEALVVLLITTSA